MSAAKTISPFSDFCGQLVALISCSFDALVALILLSVLPRGVFFRLLKITSSLMRFAFLHNSQEQVLQSCRGMPQKLQFSSMSGKCGFEVFLERIVDLH